MQHEKKTRHDRLQQYFTIMAKQVIERLGDAERTASKFLPPEPLGHVQADAPVATQKLERNIQLVRGFFDQFSTEASLAWSDPMKRWTVFYIALALIALAVAVMSFVFLWKRLHARPNLREYLATKKRE